MKVSNNRTGQPPLQKGAGACKACRRGIRSSRQTRLPAPRPDQPSNNAPLHLPHTASNNASYPKATHTHHHIETVSPETLKPKRSKLVDTAPPHRQTPASGVQNLQVAVPPPSFRWNTFLHHHRMVAGANSFAGRVVNTRPIRGINPPTTCGSDLPAPGRTRARRGSSTKKWRSHDQLAYGLCVGRRNPAESHPAA